MNHIPHFMSQTTALRVDDWTITESPLGGVFKFEGPLFRDARGLYKETFNAHIYAKFVEHIEETRASLLKQGFMMPDIQYPTQFVQDDISISRQYTLRGIHGDQKTCKAIACVAGEFYLVVVNNKPNDPQYKQWTSFMMTAQENTVILVPPGFGNGHLVMSESATFSYKQSAYYAGADKQFTIAYNDPQFNIWWPISEHNIITSERDKKV